MNKLFHRLCCRLPLQTYEIHDSPPIAAKHRHSYTLTNPKPKPGPYIHLVFNSGDKVIYSTGLQNPSSFGDQ